jgi:hypothetical protein
LDAIEDLVNDAEASAVTLEALELRSRLEHVRNLLAGE